MRHTATITLLGICFLGTGTGCATVFKDKTTTLAIQQVSEVAVDGQPVTGPSVELSNKRDHAVTYKSPSGGKEICQVESSAAMGWVLLSILSGGGWLVDWPTHNWNSLDTSKCRL